MVDNDFLVIMISKVIIHNYSNKTNNLNLNNNSHNNHNSRNNHNRHQYKINLILSKLKKMKN